MPKYVSKYARADGKIRYRYYVRKSDRPGYVESPVNKSVRPNGRTSYYVRKKEQPGYVDPRVNLSSKDSKYRRKLIFEANRVCQSCGSTEGLCIHEQPEKPPAYLVLCRICLMSLAIYGDAKAIQQRNEDIIARKQRHQSNASIARIYTLSRERVRKITA